MRYLTLCQSSLGLPKVPDANYKRNSWWVEMHSISVCLLVRSKSIVCPLSFIAVYCDFYNKEAQCSWHYEACPEQIKTCGKNNKFFGKLEGFDFFSVCIFSICFTFMPIYYSLGQ